jgi:hydrogenase nickel incorporation protein HypA/HybF
MHEMGIAASVLEAVQKELVLYPGRRAMKVGLRIGELAGVDAESVRFCFDVMVKDSEFGGLELAIEAGVSDELDFVYLELEEEAVAV